MTDRVEITGGAGPEEAAAIVAVINHVLAIEDVARRTRPPGNRPPAWMRAAMPRNPDDPLDFVTPE